TTHALMKPWSRRDVLRACLCGAGVGALNGMPLVFSRALAADATASNRILVILELSGGNDGLNTLVPYGDDAYYRLRPRIGIRPEKLRRIDQRFGFNPGMAGFEGLYKEGRMAVVHGCGYAQPSFSHFTSMAYWHTGAPNSGEETGWVGRLADAIDTQATPNFIVNIDEAQSLAVSARNHVPVVFDDPERFGRKGLYQTRPLLDQVSDATHDANPSRRYLLEVAKSAREASQLVRDAWAKYKTPVDYGIVPVDLPKIASLIAAGMPTRLYYTSYRHNAFDTHVQQPDLHQRLLTYVSDAVAGFTRDMQRIGRGDDVVMLVFSEFGRRVPENTSLGTDHGTANHMYLIGKPVKGGHYGAPSKLDALDEGDNLVFTTDFRRVYASVIEGWLGYRDTRKLLSGNFETFPVFG
ncbi:MAG TPA: DUF1501 domain-containing protein, partial [Burkholderiales bacterium]|nr:DUF1501 domain-containing protein [Burkholderiales bacterium]